MGQKNLKYGFTLVELMVVMLFVTLVIAAATPIITKRAKEVPPRLHHGKYICYRDAGGNLREHYYNSSNLTRVIELEEGQECSFTPPAKASIFKIELIGAGAGGYDLHKITNDESTRESLYSVVDYGIIEGQYYRKPTAVELNKILYNKAHYIFSQPTGEGGRGGRIEVKYTPPRKAAFKFKNEPCVGKETMNDSELPDECKFAKELVNKVIKDFEKGEYCSGRLIDYLTGGSVIYEETEPHSDMFRFCEGYASPERMNIYNDYLAPYGVAITAATAAGTFNGTTTASSGYGGYNRYLQYDGIIDFKYNNGNNVPQTEENYRNYLQTLLKGGYITKGSTSESGKGTDWSATKPRDGAPGGNKEWTPENPSDMKADDGKSVERYAAFRMDDGNVYITTKSLPLGGKGASIKVTGSQIYHNFCCYYDDKEGGRSNYIKDVKLPLSKPYNSSRGEDSGDLCLPIGIPTVDGVAIMYKNADQMNKYKAKVEGRFSVVDEQKDKLPNIYIKTTLNVRKHEVGNGGKSGQQAVYYATSLGNDCEFRVPRGGEPVVQVLPDDEKLTLEQGLVTSLSCNNHSTNYSVKGGTYDFGTKEKTFDYFEDQTPQGNVYISEGDNEVSNFKTTDNIFTRYLSSMNAQNYSFGVGGKGAKIEDRCIQHYGKYIAQIIYTDDTKEESTTDIDIPKPACAQNNTGVTEYPATAGSGGAIIISW